jgi:hypothetical protein
VVRDRVSAQKAAEYADSGPLFPCSRVNQARTEVD